MFTKFLTRNIWATGKCTRSTNRAPAPLPSALPPEKKLEPPSTLTHFAALSCSRSFWFCISCSCIFSCSSVAPAATGAAAGGLFFCAASWSTFALCSASCLCSPWMAA